jgi:hypothetical protein
MKAPETKLRRFLTNVRYLGDVGKAAKKTRVSRKQLDAWMNDHAIAVEIDKAVRAALVMAHGQETKEDIVFRIKIAPQLEMDGEIFKETGQRHRESKIIAKLAAQDLKAWRWHIAEAANNNDRNFFIDLGRILKGDVSGDLCDKTDEALIEIWAAHPEFTTRQIATKLARRGIEADENTIRKRKSRLGLNRKV